MLCIKAMRKQAFMHRRRKFSMKKLIKMLGWYIWVGFLRSRYTQIEPTHLYKWGIEISFAESFAGFLYKTHRP